MVNIEAAIDTDYEDKAIFNLPNSIKLIKGTKKYNWEIRINSLNVEELEKVNMEMIKKFGSLEV
jgi:hypothetical protein